jgi:hypothetical protein
MAALRGTTEVVRLSRRAGQVLIPTVTAMLVLVGCATTSPEEPPTDVPTQASSPVATPIPTFTVVETRDGPAIGSVALRPGWGPADDFASDDFVAAVLGTVVAADYVVMHVTEGVDEPFDVDYVKTVATIDVQSARGDLRAGDSVTVVLDGGYVPVDPTVDNGEYVEYLGWAGRPPYVVGDALYVALKRATGAKAELGEYAPLGTLTSKFDYDAKSGLYLAPEVAGTELAPLTEAEIIALLGRDF